MKYAKGIVAAVGGLCTALTPFLVDNVIGADEWVGVTSAVVAAGLTVWRVVKAENA